MHHMISSTTVAAAATITANTTAAFLILIILWSMRLTPASGLTIVRDDRVYQYVGQSNELQRQQHQHAGISNKSESENVDFESVIPEPIRDEQQQAITLQTNDSYLLQGSDKLKRISSYELSSDYESRGAAKATTAAVSEASSSSSSSSLDAGDGSWDNEEDESGNKKADMMMDEGHELTVADRTGIPDKMFIQINHVTSVAEFMNQFVLDPHHHPDNRPSSPPLDPLANDHDEGVDQDHDHHDEGDEDVHVESLFRGYGSSSSPSDPSSGSSPAAGGTSSTSPASGRRTSKKTFAMISSPAGCDVEMRTIEIKDPLKSNELYYPWCVRIPKCSGCCPSSRLKCVPTNVSFVEINVSLCLLAGQSCLLTYDPLLFSYLHDKQTNKRNGTKNTTLTGGQAVLRKVQ